MKLMFEWCSKCKLFRECYDETGPHYLEPHCGDGPYNEESEDFEYPFVEGPCPK